MTVGCYTRADLVNNLNLARNLEQTLQNVVPVVQGAEASRSWFRGA